MKGPEKPPGPHPAVVLTFRSLKRDAGTMKCLFCFFLQMLQLQKEQFQDCEQPSAASQCPGSQPALSGWAQRWSAFQHHPGTTWGLCSACAQGLAGPTAGSQGHTTPLSNWDHENYLPAAHCPVSHREGHGWILETLRNQVSGTATTLRLWDKHPCQKWTQKLKFPSYLICTSQPSSKSQVHRITVFGMKYKSFLCSLPFKKF